MTYFRNADNSDHSVRPLLTFYGVTCLSRALLLLLKTDGGEEGLNAGHGIETVGWGDVMSGDTAAALGCVPRSVEKERRPPVLCQNSALLK